MTSANLNQSLPVIGTPSKGRMKLPSKMGMSNGMASAKNVPVILPRMYLSRGTALANDRRSVPRSFSPQIASYAKRIANSESTI
ncbi:MAG: hypothetical protein ALAOOOJD_03286 [bacterium]|nr:hypothetical protein [bacterium]